MLYKFVTMISVIDMKYLSEFIKLKVFDYADASRIVGNKFSAENIIQDYMKKGYIRRIKRDLYSAVSLETNECVADKYLIASRITLTSFVSHHTAFEFYNYYNQVYYCVNVSSLTKFNDFDFDGNEYSLIMVKSNSFVENIRGIRVTSIERTIVDSIKDSGKHSDLEETLNCIAMIPYISIDAVLKYLEEINSKMLYKKVGSILSLFKDKFSIPDSFFETCHNISDSVTGHFDKNKNSHIYNAEWRIYTYIDLEGYINKE